MVLTSGMFVLLDLFMIGKLNEVSEFLSLLYSTRLGSNNENRTQRHKMEQKVYSSILLQAVGIAEF